MVVELAMTKQSGEGHWLFTVDRFQGDGTWLIQSIFFDPEMAEKMKAKKIAEEEHATEAHYRISSWGWVPSIKVDT